MITSFLSSWDLFAASYLSGWLAALTLSVLGVFVVAREQIFLGAAVAQASVLGIALSLLVSDSEILAAAWASLFSIAASLAGERGGGEGRESREAVTGWIFLSAGGLSVLLLAKSPHGTEEIHRLASSTLLGATPVDVWIFLVIAAAVFTAVSLFRRMLLLWVMDPACAAAIGLPVTALSIGLPAGL
ncbi:MAG: metal ABC transporter permease, partial [Bdellovibrionota bacterium]